jgi:hypothetical protein
VTITAGCGAVFRTLSVNVTVPVAEPGVPSGGAVFIPPVKPNTSNTKIILLPTKRLGVVNIPTGAVQFALSSESAFKGSSWKNIADLDNLLNQMLASPRIYLKFRTSQGGTSDVISYSQSVIITSDLTLQDGDIVKTKTGIDVFIVKYRNGKQYRRLILSPSVFSSYQHLRWENLKVISGMQLNKFALSNLVQVKGDRNIYELTPDGDTGSRRTIPSNQFYDVDSIYEINTTDRDSYRPR